MILVDAGPIVALIHAGDQHHQRCARAFKAIRDPRLFTVWPALTEAMYLLSFSWEAQDALWEMLEAEAIAVVPLLDRDFSRMRELMRKYRDLPMDLADAALVAVAEREKIRRVFTTDKDDFSVYGPRGLGRFSLLPV